MTFFQRTILAFPPWDEKCAFLTDKLPLKIHIRGTRGQKKHKYTVRDYIVKGIWYLTYYWCTLYNTLCIYIVLDYKYILNWQFFQNWIWSRNTDKSQLCIVVQLPTRYSTYHKGISLLLEWYMYSKLVVCVPDLLCDWVILAQIYLYEKNIVHNTAFVQYWQILIWVTL